MFSNLRGTRSLAGVVRPFCSDDSPNEPRQIAAPAISALPHPPPKHALHRRARPRGGGAARARRVGAVVRLRPVPRLRLALLRLLRGRRAAGGAVQLGRVRAVLPAANSVANTEQHPHSHHHCIIHGHARRVARPRSCGGLERLANLYHPVRVRDLHCSRRRHCSQRVCLGGHGWFLWKSFKYGKRRVC